MAVYRLQTGGEAAGPDQRPYANPRNLATPSDPVRPPPQYACMSIG